MNLVVEDREMFRHRLAPEADYYRLPAPPPPPFRPASYVLCPVTFFVGATIDEWVHAIYVVAFEQAVETARPPMTHRGLFAFWN